MMCTSCGSFLKALLYDSMQLDYIMLLVKDSSVLFRRDVIVHASAIGVCGKMWSGQYILSLPTAYAAVHKL